MSVRVNLLPREVQQRSDATRSRILMAVAALVVLGVLAAVTFVQRGRISDAEDRLAAVEATNQQLQADVVALQPFADLESRADEAVTTVGAALGNEGSMATILQDLSAVMPPTAEFSSLAVTLSQEPLSPARGGDRLVYGQLVATGQVLDGLAPGVERLIIDVDRVAAFDNAYVTTSTVDEEGIVEFTLEVELGPEALTGRYVVETAGGAQ